MNIFLWVLQGLIGLPFVVHGLLLLIQPTATRGTLEARPYSWAFLQFSGGSKLVGGLVLVLPHWLGVWPVLTPSAAAGPAVILLGA